MTITWLILAWVALALVVGPLLGAFIRAGAGGR